MTAFRIIPTVKLFNLAKKARYDGYVIIGIEVVK